MDMMLDAMKPTRLQVAAGLALGSLGLLLFWRRLALRQSRALLKDKVVLITGASSGIGEACAHAFYRAGSKVILCARRVKELERVKKELIALGLTTPTNPPHILPLDLEDLSAIPGKAAEAMKLHGRVDILINNGGISFKGAVVSTEMEVHQKVMNINYFGSVALTKALLPEMISNRDGHIVAISSVQGKLAIPFRSAYGASKHAMNAFFDSLRAEVAKYNIKVLIVCPSYTKTNISYSAVKEDGSQFGEMDPVIATGMSVDYLVRRIMNALIRNQPDVVVSPIHHKLAIYIRAFFPRLCSRIMAYQARRNTESLK